MKKIRHIYPDFIPEKLQDITRDFIESYFAYKIKSGELNNNALDECANWITTAEKDKTKDSPMAKFSYVRREFAKTYFPIVLDRETPPKDPFITAIQKLKKV